MPIYGINSWILGCKSDNITPFTIDPAWASSKVLRSQTITFSFPVGAKFTTLYDSDVVFRFARGRRWWVDSVRISIPNLAGVVAANEDIGVAGGAGKYTFTVYNNLDVPNTFITGNIPVLNDWMPVSRLVPQFGMTSAGCWIIPSNLTIQADFRNVDYTVFDGISIFAYCEIKVNSAVVPTV